MCRAAAASVGGIDVKRWEDVIQARREVAARGIQDCLKRLRQDLQRLVPADAAQMMSRVTDIIRRMLKVEQWVLQPLRNSCHSPERSALELLALEQRLSIFEKAHIVSGYGFDEMFRGG